MAVVLFAVTFVACSNDDHEDFGTSAKQDIEARAAALGFDDVAAYQASVAEQCSAGNHENCDIYNDGTHEACAYSDHSGKTMTAPITMEPIMEHMTKMVIHTVRMMVNTINNLYVRWDSIKGKQFLY